MPATVVLFGAAETFSPALSPLPSRSPHGRGVRASAAISATLNEVRIQHRKAPVETRPKESEIKQTLNNKLRNNYVLNVSEYFPSVSAITCCGNITTRRREA
jgi:hypothetical protein